MAVKRFMIAPLESGLNTATKAWLQPDDAYERMDNAYTYYGRVRKRIGATVMNTAVNPLYAQLYSRLGMNLDTTDGAGHQAFVIPGAGANGDVGQIFGVGNPALGHEIFTIISSAPGPQPMLASEMGNGTFDITTGAVVINASKLLAPIYWYPSLPVMGLPQYQIGPLNDWPTFGFDTRFAYQYVDAGNGPRWELAGGIPPAANSYTATGTDSEFIWPLNYRGAGVQDTVLFVSNNDDPIRYFANGVGWNAIPYLPQYTNNAAQTIQTALCLVYFKRRLLLFNTLENQLVGPAIRFPQRYRYTGPSFDPLDLANAFNIQSDVTRGGFDDAPTRERIVSVAALKDRLIVEFEKSTMELVYTGNEASPFKWQKINDELGVESTFSPVLFDKAVIGVGNVGVHACNGTNVERIDQDIRQTVFTINNEDFGPQRVYGIRDYANEMIYWTYPSEDAGTFPDKMLVYNYVKGSWAKNDDSITCFGYFAAIQAAQWQNFNLQWQQAQMAWNAAQWDNEFISVIAGNQEGFTFILDEDVSKNSAALSITNINFVAGAPILQIIDHNLAIDDYILVENVAGVNVADFNNQIFVVVTVPDADHVSITRADTAGQTYQGRGTVTRISRIDILTKQYNFFQQDGRNAYVSKVDFNVDRTASGEVTIDYMTSTSNASLLDAGIATGSILGTSVLETSPYVIYPYEASQSQLWHPIYFQAEGEYIQLRIYLSDSQMFINNIVFSDFEINAFTIYAEPTSTRLQ